MLDELYADQLDARAEYERRERIRAVLAAAIEERWLMPVAELMRWISDPRPN